MRFMTNPLKFLFTFLHLQPFVAQPSEGTRVNHGHNLKQSSEATKPSLPPSSSPPPQTTTHHPEIINQERAKENHLSINIDCSSSSSSSSSLLSNLVVPLPKETASPWETPLSPSSQEDPVNPSRALDHPVFEMVRGQELGRHVLVLVIPIVIFLITTYKPLNMSMYFTLPVTLLCIGFMVIWNGILLRRVFRHASNWIEIVGISLVLLAFFGIIAHFLPVYATWIPYLCWVLTVIPFLVPIFDKKDGNGQPVGASHKSSVPLLPLKAASGVEE